MLNSELRTYKNKMDSHIHNYGHLILPKYGSLTVKTNLHDVKLNKHLFYLPSDTLHEFHAEDFNQFLVVDIKEKDQMILPCSEIHQVMDEQWLMIQSLLESEKGKDLSNLMTYVFSKLSNHLPRSSVYIHENYHRNISLKDLAAMKLLMKLIM